MMFEFIDQMREHENFSCKYMGADFEVTWKGDVGKVEASLTIGTKVLRSGRSIHRYDSGDEQSVLDNFDGQVDVLYGAAYSSERNKGGGQ